MTPQQQGCKAKSPYEKKTKPIIYEFRVATVIGSRNLEPSCSRRKLCSASLGRKGYWHV